MYQCVGSAAAGAAEVERMISNNSHASFIVQELAAGYKECSKNLTISICVQSINWMNVVTISSKDELNREIYFKRET